MIDEKALGQNISFHRRRRGLSQVELANLLDRSESWVSQVERGARSLDRLSVLNHVADVLGVPLGDLIGKESPFPTQGNQPAHIEALQFALTRPVSAVALVDSQSGRSRKPNAKQLRKRTEQCWTLAHNGAAEELSLELTELVPALEEAVAQQSPDLSELFSLLAQTYEMMTTQFAFSGAIDVVRIAGDRAVNAAVASGDPLQTASSIFRLTLALISIHNLDAACQTASEVADALRSQIDSLPNEAWSMIGALRLSLAVAEARRNEAGAARSNIDAAKEAAEHVAVDANDFDTEFNIGNVAVHEVSVEMELGNAGEALRLAGEVQTEQLSPERRSRLLMESAFAHAQLRQFEAAVESLLAACEVARERVLQNRRAQQLIRDFQKMDREVSRLSALQEYLET